MWINKALLGEDQIPLNAPVPNDNRVQVVPLPNGRYNVIGNRIRWHRLRDDYRVKKVDCQILKRSRDRYGEVVYLEDHTHVPNGD